MRRLTFKCRICKDDRTHEIQEEFGGLPLGCVVGMCLGCGVLGIHPIAPLVESAHDTPDN